MDEDIIASVYDGVLENAPWTATLSKLRRVTGAHRLMLKFSSPNPADGSAIYTNSVSAEDDWAPDGPSDIYRRVYQWKDPVYYGGMLAGDVRQLDELIDRRTFRSSDYYKGLCAPLDIEHAFFAYLGRCDGADVWLNGSRGAGQGAFASQEIGAIRKLLPHMSRAVKMRSRLERLQAQSMIYDQSTSALGVGVVMLDRWGNIVETNAKADAILADGSPVGRVGERLSLVGAAQQNYAAALEHPGARHARTVIATDGCASVNLVVRAAQDMDMRAAPSQIAFTVYLSRGPQKLSPKAIDFVSQAFGLSPVEARFAMLLANGHALDEIATLLGVTLTTARTYCKRVFGKTGTTRQTELVRLLLSSLASLA